MRGLAAFCLVGTLYGAALAAPKMMPNAPPTTALNWWDVSCWLAPWGSWCPQPVKDPSIPQPKTLTPDTPTCDVYGPCQ